MATLCQWATFFSARSAHAGDGGVKLTACRAVKQGDAVARLQAQHLHMAGRTGGQVQFGTRGKRGGAVKAWHAAPLHAAEGKGRGRLNAFNLFYQA